MTKKELCLALVQCDKEKEVIELLQKEGYWDDPEAWRNYGDRETNFSQVGSQQSKAEYALVEKIVNSVDAMLMAECLRRSIDPKGSKAPQSIQEALLQFYGIYEGKLFSLEKPARTKLAENICLVATGGRRTPCYSIIDKGEGQTPKKMPDTILSLDKSNKLRIPFVQGRFNMGGTGVFQFCGRHNLQLVISKRHPGVAKFENDDSKSEWGFTIVRRESPSMGVRNSIYRYLAPQNEIISFRSDALPLLPGKYPNPYEKKLEWGTFIKLYEYQMRGIKTLVTFDLYYRLSLLLPEIALPVRIYERRKGYKSHYPEINLSGLSVRLKEDRGENLEDGFNPAPTVSFRVQGQEMKASIYVFKKGQSTHYTKNEGVIFTVNGQAHGFFPKTFFGRQAVGMGVLSDSILVIVDCSNLDTRSREDFIMNSRDKLRELDFYSDIEQNLEHLIKYHAGLRELKERRHREEIQEKIGDEKPLAEVIESIIKKSPTLTKLFLPGFKITNPLRTKGVKAKKKYKGNKFPTYFNLEGEYTPECPKIVPKNVRFRIKYTTDASNDYFNRDYEPGKFSLKLNGEEVKDRLVSLWNGVANLTVRLPEGVRIGTLLHFESEVTDVKRVEPFRHGFYVKVEEKVDKRRDGKRRPRKRRPPPDNKEGEDSRTPSGLRIPAIKEVTREHWEDHSPPFDKETAIKIAYDRDHGYIFWINVDNAYFRRQQIESMGVDKTLLQKRYVYGLVLIALALLHETKSKGDKNDVQERINGFSEIEKACKGIAPFLLPMISSLSRLDVPEIVTTYQEV